MINVNCTDIFCLVLVEHSSDTISNVQMEKYNWNLQGNTTIMTFLDILPFSKAVGPDSQKLRKPTLKI